MKVRYLVDVTSPPARVGVINQIRNLDRRVALQMIREEIVSSDLTIPEACELGPPQVASPTPPKVESTVDIEYLVDITSPAEQVGKKGEVKPVRKKVADQLVEANYAKKVKPKKTKGRKKDDSINKKRNIGSK